jgi:2-polyprenyl-6-methoxyphenol hydroxylase-like FAD-dependent oxidoreductase
LALLDPVATFRPVGVSRRAQRYDVIVVGARCAGAATALVLSRAGLRVLCLERAPAMSDTISTHYIHREGVAILDKWGVLDDLRRTACPSISKVRYQLEDLTLEKAIVDAREAPIAPRRHILDPVLASAAAAQGADVRYGCRVTDLIWSNHAVIGVRAVTKGGVSFTESAMLVVGADGINSTIARLVQAQKYREYPARTCVYYTYWAGVQMDARMTIRRQRAALAFPTHDGATLVAAIWPHTSLPKIRADIEQNFLETVRATDPMLAGSLRAEDRIERFFGTGHLRAFFRAAAGPGWVLIGDAGLHKDPLPANGITDAWVQAEDLAQELMHQLDCQNDAVVRLSRFWRHRDETFGDIYEMTHHFAGMSFSQSSLELLSRGMTDAGVQSPGSTLGKIVRLLAAHEEYGTRCSRQ